MGDLFNKYIKYFNNDFVLAVASNQIKTTDSTFFDNAGEIKPYRDAVKIKIRPIALKGRILFQVTRTVGAKEMHENLEAEAAAELLDKVTGTLFKQIEITGKKGSITVLTGKKGTVTVKERAAKVAGSSVSGKKVNGETEGMKSAGSESGMKVNGETGGTKTAGSESGMKVNSETGGMKSAYSESGEMPGASHNRIKNYCLPEGEPVPFLVELGVMTAAGKVVAAKYDKFRQINRYLEFVADIVPQLPTDREISIIDFGCGKSYLTFALYYYLHEKLGFPVRITGLDLKEDVIAHCNELAEKFGYEGLSFLHGNIADYTGTDSVDMVVTLHACDTATDFALEKAVKWGAKVIFCVPCCQHELNRQIKCDTLAPIFKYGLLKERMAALITDGLRANMLEEAGYRTQILEFIDMEHTPKNILIRGVRQPLKIRKKTGYREVEEFLNVEPTLEKLLDRTAD